MTHRDVQAGLIGQLRVVVRRQDRSVVRGRVPCAPSNFRSFSADADQRSVSLTRSEGFSGALKLSSASICEGSHHHVRWDSRMAEGEWSALKHGLMLTFYQLPLGPSSRRSQPEAKPTPASEVTETCRDSFIATIRNRNTRQDLRSRMLAVFLLAQSSRPLSGNPRKRGGTFESTKCSILSSVLTEQWFLLGLTTVCSEN
jgi:hypothetical protein